jgi:hypothetical protein
MAWDYISELRPPAGLMFIPQMIWVWSATMEWYWLGKTEKLGENLSQCQSVNHKSHMDWPAREPGSQRWKGRKVTAWVSEFFCFPLSFHRVLHTHIPSAGWTTGPLLAQFRESLVQSTRGSFTNQEMETNIIMKLSRIWATCWTLPASHIQKSLQWPSFCLLGYSFISLGNLLRGIRVTCCIHFL